MKQLRTESGAMDLEAETVLEEWPWQPYFNNCRTACTEGNEFRKTWYRII